MTTMPDPTPERRRATDDSERVAIAREKLSRACMARFPFGKVKLTVDDALFLVGVCDALLRERDND